MANIGSVSALALLLGVTAAMPARHAAAQMPNLSLEETRQCLMDERDLDRRKSDLEARRPALAREEADMSALKRRVEELQNRVFIGATPDPMARTEYEGLRDRQYAEFDRHSARQREYNNDVARYNDALTTFNGRCGGSRYTDYNLREARRQLGW